LVHSGWNSSAIGTMLYKAFRFVETKQLSCIFRAEIQIESTG